MEKLKQAAELHDCEAVIALFADDIVIRSPITTLIRFEGIEQAGDLFRRVFDVIEDIRFYETVGEGLPTQVIFWHGRVGGHYLEEANLLRLNDTGQIAEMTVFMRALPGLLALAERLAASLAGRKNKWRYVVVRLMLGFVGKLYRSNEAFVVGLTKAGVWVK
jgi:SnoaL-like domain